MANLLDEDSTSAGVVEEEVLAGETRLLKVEEEHREEGMDVDMGEETVAGAAAAEEEDSTAVVVAEDAAARQS